jgi:tripartite-type tricarboxylate transporter receptor subunit TctC
MIRLLVAIPLALAATAGAQTYPTKPVRLIVASAPGGAPDILGRAVALKLTESLGQQVVVDNRAGASGIIGAELAARSAPDGYTLLLGTTTLNAVLPQLKRKLPYSTQDFAPISQIAITANIVVVTASLPARTIPELIQLAKAKPINYASAGNGTPAHLAGEMLNLMGGIRMGHIPYKGAGPALTDVIAGQVQVLITSPIAALPHVQTGKLRALATSGAKRNPALPDLPAVAETLPGYEITQWWGLLAPARTPQPVLARLHADTARAVAAADVREKIAAQGATAVGNTPQEFAAFMAAEITRLANLIRQAGIPVED